MVTGYGTIDDDFISNLKRELVLWLAGRHKRRLNRKVAQESTGKRIGRLLLHLLAVNPRETPYHGIDLLQFLALCLGLWRNQARGMSFGSDVRAPGFPIISHWKPFALSQSLLRHQPPPAESFRKRNLNKDLALRH